MRLFLPNHLAHTIATFDLAGTPILVRRGFPIYLFVWGVLTGLLGAKDLSLLGFLWRLACLVYADLAHAAGHIWSARQVGAPMDGFVLRAFPIAVYANDAVTPRQHVGRALGGPAFSLLSMVIGLALRGLADPDTALREMAGWFAVSNAFVGLGALLPGPQLDGGVLLRWGLYDGDEQASYRLARRIAGACAVGLSAAGAGLLARGQWRLGALALLSAGAVIFGLLRFA